MARVEVPIVVVNSSTGLPVSGAAITLTRRSNGALVPWYTTETGGTGSTAAIITDSAGRVNAWVERGAYNLAVTGTGITPYTEAWDASPGGDSTIDTLWVGTDVAARVLGAAVLSPFDLNTSTSQTLGTVAATHNNKPGRVFLVAHAVLDFPPFSISIRRNGTIVWSSAATIGTEGGLVCAAYSFSALSGAQTWTVTVDTSGGGQVHAEGDGLVVVVEQ